MRNHARDVLAMTRLLLSALLLALLAAVPCPAQELLKNPGFEQFAETGVPVDWGRYGGRVPESQLAASVSAHSGERALRLLDTGPQERDGKWSVGVSQDVPAEPDRYYLLSAWCKCAARNNDGAVNMQLRFLPSQKLHVVKLTAPVGGDWREFSVAGCAPAGTTRIRVYLYTEHFWTADCLLDDASLKQIDAAQWGARFPLLALGSNGVEELRELNVRTPIVRNGEPAATILVPAGVAYAALGDQLAGVIAERTGGRLTVTTAGSPLVADPDTVIALGNLNDNWVIERLYWNRYLQIDSLSPGPGRYVLQTVHEPHNGPKGKNVLVIGASDVAGLRAGVEDFAGRIPRGRTFVLPEPLLFVSGVEPMAAAARDQMLSRAPSNDALRDFWTAVRRYRDTGDLAYAEHAKRILLFCGTRFEQDPHYHVTWPEETSSDWLGAMWDVLEEAPVFSDQERLRCTNIMLATLYNLPPRCSGYRNLERNDTIIWNHTTFPLMGIYWLARYFERHYGNVDGRIDLMLRKVRAAFAGQVTSWKPQEDSCGYVSIVPRHTIEYTLAEGDYTYFENGSVLRHAEYEVGFCDNTGDAAGFGDSGYGHGPYARNVHWALWYHRDGRILWWLNRITENGYKNPYDPRVKPVPWDELVGVKVFELHPQVYEYTRTRSDYGGEVTPPNIPLRKAFDKVSFRESLDSTSEYFLLDGYSRGKHLQYDGNAIIKFYADGHDWLIDGDYLVRNTTDHNTVSIVRDGRCAQLIPPCAALDCVVDLPQAAMTETSVHDYNGADWSRSIFWLKGEFVVVMDRLTARQAATFTFLGNWKTLADGEQTLTDGRTFSTSRQGLGGVGSRDLVTVANPADGVRQAVKFATQQARLDMGLNLPAGKYSMTLFASGTSSGADSFYVSVDDGERVAFHIPIGPFGPSASSWTKDTATPSIEVTTAGLHRVTISLREAPGPLLDRILIRDSNGRNIADIEAETAPDLPADWFKPAPASRFFVKNDGLAQGKLTGRINHVGRHITYFRERLGGELKSGEVRTLHNVFYNDTDEAPKRYDVRRISDEAVLVLRRDEPFMVCAAGATAKVAGPVEAHLTMFTRNRVWTAYDRETSADQPQAAPAAQVFDALSRRAQTAPATEAERTSGTEPLQVVWTRTIPVDDQHQDEPILKIFPVDLNGDDTDEIIVLRSRAAHCLDAQGTRLWTFETGGICRAVCAADLDGDGTAEVLLGSDDERIHVLDANGMKQREHHANIPLRVGRSSVRQPRVGSLAAGDVDNDGKVDIIAGLLNANVVRYDASFNLVWRCDSVEHGTGDVQLVQLDDDEALEIACANKYGAVEIFEADGAQCASVYSELGDVVMAFGDMDGDGKVEVANGSSTGAFTCQTFRGEVRFRFPNYGFAVRAVAMADVRGDACPELLLASETGYVYIVGADGGVLAQRDLGDAVNDVLVMDRRRIAVACADGSLRIMDGNAVIRAAHHASGSVKIVAATRVGGRARVLAATAGALLCCAP